MILNYVDYNLYIFLDNEKSLQNLNTSMLKQRPRCLSPVKSNGNNLIQTDQCSSSSISSFSSVTLSQKKKRNRTAFAPSQLLRLEEEFEKCHYLIGHERRRLCTELNLTETQIKVWFQNRRTKHKREKHK